MYIFLLAGCEVTLSALVLCLGNFLCITRKQNERKKTKSIEEQELNQEGQRNEDDKEEPNGQAAEVIIKELGNKDNTHS